MDEKSLETHYMFEKMKSAPQYANKHNLGPAGQDSGQEQDSILEPSNVFVMQQAMQSGTKLNPGVKLENPGEKAWEEALQREDIGTVFAQAVLQSSPFGMLDRSGGIKASDIENPTARKAYYVGSVLGKAGNVALWILTGAGVGGAVSKSVKAAEVVGKLGGTSKAAQAVRGALKGSFIGSMIGKVLTKHAEGYNPLETAIDVGGDIVAFKGFEYGVRKGSELPIKNRVRKAFADKRSRVYIGETEQELIWKEKGTTYYVRGKFPTVIESKGSLNTKPKPVELRSSGEKVGYRPRKVIASPSGNVKDLNTIDELKFLEGEENLPPQLYTRDTEFVKRVSISKPSGSKLGVKDLGVKDNGLELLTKSKTSISRTAVNEAMRTLNTKRAFAQAMKNVKPVNTNFAYGLSGILFVVKPPEIKPSDKPGTQGEVTLEEQNVIKWKIKQQKIKHELDEAQNPREKLEPTPITTYAPGLIKQIKQELGQDEQQKQNPRRPEPTPHPLQEPEPQIQEEVTIPVQTPKPLTGEQEAPIEIPKEALATITGLTGSIVSKAIPKVITLPKPPRRSRSVRISRASGSALWKKSGRKNKNKIFSLDLPKPKNPFALKKVKKKGGRRNGIF